MLFLLRNIRRKLLTGNKVTTYLLYAIGEIILVVVGILIAVSIDDWNKKKEQNQRRLELIRNLKSDVEADLKRLEGSLKVAENINSSSLTFLDIASTANDEIPTDSLVKYASTTFYLATFKPLTSTYSTAQSTGDIGLLQDKQLLELFLDYEESYEWLELHAKISGDMVYKGSHWELRKKLGANYLLLLETKEYAPPERFKLPEEEMRAYLLSKEFYATFENMHWIQRNIYRALHRLNELDSTINQRLDILLKPDKE